MAFYRGATLMLLEFHRRRTCLMEIEYLMHLSRNCVHAACQLPRISVLIYRLALFCTKPQARISSHLRYPVTVIDKWGVHQISTRPLVREGGRKKPPWLYIKNGVTCIATRECIVAAFRPVSDAFSKAQFARGMIVSPSMLQTNVVS